MYSVWYSAVRLIVYKGQSPFWLQEDIIRNRLYTIWEGKLFQQSLAEDAGPWQKRAINASAAIELAAVRSIMATKFVTYPSGCCSSASPRSHIGCAPSCTSRLYN